MESREMRLERPINILVTVTTPEHVVRTKILRIYGIKTNECSFVADMIMDDLQNLKGVVSSHSDFYLEIWEILRDAVNKCRGIEPRHTSTMLLFKQVPYGSVVDGSYLYVEGFSFSLM
jgi:hypothetical protein